MRVGVGVRINNEEDSDDEDPVDDNSELIND